LADPALSSHAPELRREPLALLGGGPDSCRHLDAARVHAVEADAIAVGQALKVLDGILETRRNAEARGEQDGGLASRLALQPLHERVEGLDVRIAGLGVGLESTTD